MTYLSILEKLEIFFNTLMDFEFVLIFALLLLFFTLLYSMKKLSGKKYILYIFLVFTLVFGISIVNNYDVLYNTFDNFTNIFFENIYFPSIYVYIGILIISFVTFITSMLNVMLNKIYKIINSIMFVLNNVLFVVILNIIAKNKVDIFSVNSLYTDTNLVALLELSMGLCVLWVFSLLIVYVTNVICDSITNKKIYNEETEFKEFNSILEVTNDEIIISNVDNVMEEVPANCNVISENDINNTAKELMELENINECEGEEKTLNSTITFNDILNGCIPVTYYDNSALIEEYNLVNPQTIYEENYNKIKDYIAFNDLNIMLNAEEAKTNTNKEECISDDYELSVEEFTIKEKNKVSEERLINNTISLNDLIDDNRNIKNENNIIDLEINENNEYSINDYKKIADMLTSLKANYCDANIKIDDAVAISLIKNYSVDDCLKFKNILENNLN